MELKSALFEVSNLFSEAGIMGIYIFTFKSLHQWQLGKSLPGQKNCAYILKIDIYMFLHQTFAKIGSFKKENNSKSGTDCYLATRNLWRKISAEGGFHHYCVLTERVLMHMLTSTNQ